MTDSISSAASGGEKAEKISLECIMACIYFMCLPFTVVTTSFGSLLKVVTMPVILVLAVRILMGKSDIVPNYLHFLYTVYVLYTISMLFVFSDDIAVTTTKDIVLGLFMFLLVSLRVYNKRETEWIESAWVIMGIFCIYVCLTSTEVVSDVESRAVIRVFGFEEDQNQFCAYFVMPVLISLKRFIERRKFYLVYLVIIALSFYAILKTGSRGGLIGVFAGVSLYIAAGVKSVKTKVIVISSAALFAFLFVTVAMPMLPEDVAMRYSVDSVVESGGTGRFEIWQFLLDYSFKDPVRLIRGSGIFSSYGIMFSAGFINGVAHNAFVQILNDEGFIGLLLFLAVIAACIFRNLRRAPLYACAFFALIAFAMSLTFYVFKPYINILIMCALTVEGNLPEDRLNEAGEADG